MRPYQSRRTPPPARRQPARTHKPHFHLRLPSFTAYDMVSRLQPATRQTLIGALGVLLLFFATYLYVFSPTGYLARREVQKAIEAKELEIAEVRGAGRKLAQQLARLEKDSSTIEAIARNELSMVRPGETVYRMPNDSTPEYVLNY